MSAAAAMDVTGVLVDAEARQARASAWFRELRDAICARMEGIEDAYADGPFSELPAGRFERSKTHRTGEGDEDAGGGEMAVMRESRVFEKVGVNISTVYGSLAPRAQKMMASRGIPGVEADPRFWAAGISLVAHMRSPKVPAVHMNTRMFWTPSAWWFGGGGDLNPMVPVEEDTAFFHAAYKTECDKHNSDYYPRYKAWADEYFMIKHRNFARGVGGIFYDDHNTGDWEADFAFTQDVGRSFLAAHPPLVEKRMNEPWTEEDRAHQLKRRGYYAEFNLCYDRGTKFGLETGHNIEAVLMSMPPLAAWP